MKLVLLFVLSLTIIAFSVSCDTQTTLPGNMYITGNYYSNGTQIGQTGAQGPKGDTGDTGPAGADGQDGAPGNSFISLVYKTGDESVISSTNLQHDDHLYFSVVSGHRYIAHVFALVTGHTSGDIKWAATDTSSNITTTCSADYIATLNTLTSESSYIANNINSGVNQWMGGYIWVVASADGTVYFDWAQNASYGTATQILTGSFLTLYTLN